MSDAVTYKQALKRFQSQPLEWEALIRGLTAKREEYIADMKRNMNTPNCNEFARFEVNGAIIAVDDLIYDFQLPVQEAEEE